MQIQKQKSGQVSALAGGILAFVMVGIIAVIGFLIVGQVQLQTVGNTSAYNATLTVSSAMNTFVSWLPIVAIATIGGIVLMLVMRYFGGGGKGGV